jgi:hypothetical protein
VIQLHRIGDAPQTHEERDVLSVFLRVNPLFDAIRDDPRFERLIQRIGIPLLDGRSRG